MIEKIVYDYATNQLPIPVFMELPEVPSENYPRLPDEFVVIEKVGGSSTNKIRFASIAVQSYSLRSLYNASVVNEAVKHVMECLPANVDDVSDCRLTADTNFTDTRTKRYRYQCVFSLYY